MIGRELKFHDGKKGAALALRIIQDAEEDMLRKVLKDGTVVVHLKGNPADLKGTLIQYLSSVLNLERNRFDIIQIKDGADMLLSILDIEPGEIQNLILEKIE
jgi:hypothetical protein